MTTCIVRRNAGAAGHRSADLQVRQIVEVIAAPTRQMCIRPHDFQMIATTMPRSVTECWNHGGIHVLHQDKPCADPSTDSGSDQVVMVDGWRLNEVITLL